MNNIGVGIIERPSTVGAEKLRQLIRSPVKLIIDRQHWLRKMANGHYFKDCGACLFDDEVDAMCCLGWDGYMVHDIPMASMNRYCDPRTLGTWTASVNVGEAIGINDRTEPEYDNITDLEQEQLLINLWAEAGIELSFIN